MQEAIDLSMDPWVGGVGQRDCSAPGATVNEPFEMICSDLKWRNACGSSLFCVESEPFEVIGRDLERHKRRGSSLFCFGSEPFEVVCRDLKRRKCRGGSLFCGGRPSSPLVGDGLWSH